MLLLTRPHQTTYLASTPALAGNPNHELSCGYGANLDLGLEAGKGMALLCDVCSSRPASCAVPGLHSAKATGSHVSRLACLLQQKRSLTCLAHGKNRNWDLDRREILIVALVLGVATVVYTDTAGAEFTDMPALKGKDYGKSKMKYPDFTQTQSGLQYKDLKVGAGPIPKAGEIVVVDWAGYTIGYYGRIFEARNKAKGGSFEGNEKDLFRFKLGMDEVIPAFEEAVSSMGVGGVRRVIVPPGLGYPDNDFNKKAPKPTTFSGQRALDFVLKNQGLIDKTLLFDIELLRIDKSS